MARVVGIHGVGHQVGGPESLGWLTPLRDGMQLAGRTPLDGDQLAIAFYGNLFRKRLSKTKSTPVYTAVDVAEDDEKDLLFKLWDEVQPEAITKARTPALVQRALNALTHLKFFAGIAEHVLIADLKQVHAYFTNPPVRAAIQGVVAQAVDAETRVIIGHSLGSVVAYEALAAHPEWNVSTLITLGSPLGIANVVFDRLEPSPTGGLGAWPGSVTRWTNVASPDDVVALVKQLSTRFGERVHDVLVDNETTAHDAAPYLTATETGRAIADGLE